MNNDTDKFYNLDLYKKLYIKKGLILIDFFIIIGLIQYFVFEGSFNYMITWLRDYFLKL